MLAGLPPELAGHWARWLASALAAYRTADRVGRHTSWPLRRQACWPQHELASALVGYRTAGRLASVLPRWLAVGRACPRLRRCAWSLGLAFLVEVRLA